MQGLAKWFFTSAVTYAVLGMLLGLHMAIGHDHSQRPTHAHIMVVGWLSFAIFGFFYYLLGKSVPRIAGLVHFWMAQVSLAGLVVGLWLLYSGYTEYEPLAAASATGYALSFLVFAYVAFSALRAPTAA